MSAYFVYYANVLATNLPTHVRVSYHTTDEHKILYQLYNLYAIIYFLFRIRPRFFIIANTVSLLYK